MTKQEFLQTYLVERCGTDCSKWDGLKEKFGEENLLAMWVADMEFKTCDGIVEAMMERTQHGVFGYRWNAGIIFRSGRNGYDFLRGA